MATKSPIDGLTSNKVQRIHICISNQDTKLIHNTCGNSRRPSSNSDVWGHFFDLSFRPQLDGTSGPTYRFMYLFISPSTPLPLSLSFEIRLKVAEKHDEP